jgi:hypothetical protein
MENSAQVSQYIVFVIPLLFILGIIAFLFYLRLRMFEKMGIAGWKCLVIFYSDFVLFEKLYDNGWRFLYKFIPFYGLYVDCKCWADIAKGFQYEPAFAIGLILAQPIFTGILAFSDCEWEDGIDDVEGKYNKVAKILAIILNIFISLWAIVYGGMMLLIIIAMIGEA